MRDRRFIALLTRLDRGCYLAHAALVELVIARAWPPGTDVGTLRVKASHSKAQGGTA